MSRRATLLLLALIAGCGSGGAALPPAERAEGGLGALDDSRWAWVQASCSDGALPLGAEGYESELLLQVEGTSLRMVYDNAIVTRGCIETAVWLARPEHEEWAFEPEARVFLPPDVDCGAELGRARRGSLRLSGDMLEVVTYRSPWCRGFDASFAYVRIHDGSSIENERLISRYMAHFNRQDANAIAAMFAEGGSLVEPFTESRDGNHARHEGREQVRLWYERAFADASWLALRMLSIERIDQGQYVASWEYIDDKLEKPFQGRNLFVIAGGEIYETELQLLSEVRPRYQ